MPLYLVSIIGGDINNKSKKWPPLFLFAYVNHIRLYILIHAINSPMDILCWFMIFGSSIFTFRFFTMTITIDLLNGLFHSKGGNRIHDFIIFPTYCSDVSGHISNHIWWSTLLFVHFCHISQYRIFYSVCLSKAGVVKSLSITMW